MTTPKDPHAFEGNDQRTKSLVDIRAAFEGAVGHYLLQQEEQTLNHAEFMGIAKDALIGLKVGDLQCMMMMAVQMIEGTLAYLTEPDEFIDWSPRDVFSHMVLHRELAQGQ